MIDELDDARLDDQAVCFGRVARARGIETATVFGSAYRTAAGGRLWLTFELGGTRFFYADGCLLIADDDHGDALGRFINSPADRLVRNKTRLAHHLAQAGIPVPEGRSFTRGDVGAAMTYAASLKGPVCLKPDRGARGVLVFPDRRTMPACEEAFAAIARRAHDIRLERSLPGAMVRYFYVRPRAVAVKLSRAPAVVGDGHAPVADLIADKNAERRRRALPSHPEIRVDAALIGTLAEQGVDLSVVVASGRSVLLRRVTNGFLGGESVECADHAHPDYATVAEAACVAVPNLVTATIDMKILDHTQPAMPGNHWVLEINSNIGVLPYHYPWEGRSQNVTGAVLDFLARDIVVPGWEY